MFINHFSSWCWGTWRFGSLNFMLTLNTANLVKLICLNFENSICYAGPGQGIEHLFYYPEQAQENYVVNQYVNADAGAKGLAEIVKEISDAAIKVQRTQMRRVPLSRGTWVFQPAISNNILLQAKSCRNPKEFNQSERANCKIEHHMPSFFLMLFPSRLFIASFDSPKVTSKL